MNVADGSMEMWTKGCITMQGAVTGRGALGTSGMEWISAIPVAPARSECTRDETKQAEAVLQSLCAMDVK